MARRKSNSLPDSSEKQIHHDDNNNNNDIISNLPDSILGHILSLLPTKNAVAAGILSKRWKLLWTTTVNLDFCCPIDYTGSVEQFVQFVNYVLFLHKPGYLNRFSLTWKSVCIPFYVNIWISVAAVRNVHELIVNCLISELPIQVQEFMFSCERLQTLELNCNICISSEIDVYLPRLEILQLRSVYFRSEKDFSKLIDGCPVLKYLVILMDIGNMIKHGHINPVDGNEFKCIISSPFLKTFVLDVYDLYQSPILPSGLCSVELDAPSLQFINLKGQIHNIFVKQKGLTFLGAARILPSGLNFQEPNYCNSLVVAVGAFGCAKALMLSDQVVHALNCATIKMKTKFSNLKLLAVPMKWNYWSALLHFISLSESLEILLIHKGKEYYINEMHFNNSNWKTPNLVPKCLSSSLWKVVIGCYSGYPDELAMVQYILKHGSVLRDMDICFDKSTNDLERKYEVVRKISSFPRRSPICEVNFHKNDPLDALFPS